MRQIKYIFFTILSHNLPSYLTTYHVMSFDIVLLTQSHMERDLSILWMRSHLKEMRW